MTRLCFGRCSLISRLSLLLAMTVLLIGAVVSPSVAETIFEDRFEEPLPPSTLNDTGIVWSGDYRHYNATDCDPSHPAGQDCHYGRDAQAAAGSLNKIGGSTPNNGIENGFDYTRICNSGEAAGEGDCPSSPVLGSGPDDWGCTRDNFTGLIWEVKTTSGLRSQDHTYSWYDRNNPSGSPGREDGGYCHESGRCDTEKFVADINAQGLCGANDWRLPTVYELSSILDTGRYEPAIDPEYFSHTPASIFWSSTPIDSYWPSVWIVDFNSGSVYYDTSQQIRHVRLVRAGQ